MTIEGLSYAKSRLTTLDNRFWSWAMYGDPGTRKTLVIRDILRDGRFKNPLYLDAEQGDMTLGTSIDCEIIHFWEVKEANQLARPWGAVTRVVKDLNDIATSCVREKKEFPYDLIVLEGTSLIAQWCEDDVVANNPNNEVAKIADFNVIKSRMTTQLYILKWLPCNMIVTARMRNDPPQVSLSDGATVSTGADRFSPKFIPSFSKEFSSMWDIVSRLELNRSMGAKGTTLQIISDHDAKGIQKDRFGTLPAVIDYSNKSDGSHNASWILDQIEKGWKEATNTDVEEEVRVA